MGLDNDNKTKISKGIIVKKEDIASNKLIPKDIIDSVKSAPYYLLIFIVREEIVKINIFPIETKNIKKILINLEAFSPDLVNSISEVLKKLKLKDFILFTTGICYSDEACFYESYFFHDNDKTEILDQIKNSFSNIPKVLKVVIEDLEIL